MVSCNPNKADFSIKEFVFGSGETLAELRQHYLTLGTPRRDSQGRIVNAVLLLHNTTGTSTSWLAPGLADELFSDGQPLDASRLFLIMPDAIGFGGSSKPSDGLRARFPQYRYTDMVTAQHRLLTEGLGIAHLRLVLGLSMGGMLTWLWGEMHPDFMDALAPIACQPTAMSGRNWMQRRMAIEAIRSDPDWRGGDYTTPPERGLRTALAMLFMMTSSPMQQQKAAPTRDSADVFITRYIDGRLHTTDANDMLYAFDASRDYDPSAKLESIRAAVLAINSADDVVNPPELGLMEKLMPRVAHGRYVLIPTSDRTRGHGTQSLPAVWKDYLAEFLGQLP